MNAIETLIEHAKEIHPHFESERGQRDIQAAAELNEKMVTALHRIVEISDRELGTPGLRLELCATVARAALPLLAPLKEVVKYTTPVEILEAGKVIYAGMWGKADLAGENLSEIIGLLNATGWCQLKARPTQTIRMLSAGPVADIVQSNQEASLNRVHRISEAEAKPVKKTIKAGQVLTARSIGDFDCIYTINVLGRRGRLAQITELKGDNKKRRVMVREDQDGNEYLRPDNHSFAPMFRAID